MEYTSQYLKYINFGKTRANFSYNHDINVTDYYENVGRHTNNFEILMKGHYFFRVIKFFKMSGILRFNLHKQISFIF